MTIYFFIFLHPLLNTFASSPTRSLCRSDQRDALLELRKEFPIYSNDNDLVTTVWWNKSVDCCSWYGVKCDAMLGEVILLQLCFTEITVNTSLKSSSGLFKLQHLTYLDLSRCNLQGEIPSSIGNLSRLTSLDLSYNQLVGEVPASICNLNQLDYIDLSENHLRGNIPTSFANFTNLFKLNLRENKFTGGVRVLSNLTSLSEIDISLNHFKSSIPTSMLMLPWLDEIDLSGNQFEGSIDFGNTSSSSKLRVLHVGNNNFDGLIPESISKLGNLLSLDLSHNNLGGQVPSYISELGNLLSLDLSHNNLGGRVPRSISKLVNLTSVDLSYNKLEGQVPHCIWTSSDLRSLKLSHNGFTSFENSVDIINETLLELLDLGSNSLQGPFRQWICNFTNLSYLDLSNNHFTGSIPRCLKNFSLIGLNLRNTSLSGFLPDFDGFELESLDVSHNNLKGKLPKSLINCGLLEFLNVKGNKINDTFPFWLGSLQYLNVLILGSNAFHGPVYNSSAYLGFPSMKIIDISNNNFVGSLPQDYFAKWLEMSKVWSDEGTPEMNYMSVNFTSYDSIDLVYKGVDTNFLRIFQGFRAIDFSGNRFYGHIPGSIGLLSELRLLNLSGNTFTGNIPPSLANITNLETLDLSRNNLSGEIPQSLGKLTFLSNINFSYNHLEGFVPRSTQFGSQNCSSFMGNPGLYGLDDICKDIHVPEESLSEQDEPALNWIAAAIAFGPGVFCGLVIGYIFASYKHEWFI